MTEETQVVIERVDTLENDADFSNAEPEKEQQLKMGEDNSIIGATSRE